MRASVQPCLGARGTETDEAGGASGGSRLIAKLPAFWGEPDLGMEFVRRFFHSSEGVTCARSEPRMNVPVVFED